MRRYSKKRCGVVLALALLALSRTARGQDEIVADGVPRAVIITADHPVSSVKLAAAELQAYLEKISGAKLPVTTASEVTAVESDALPVRIYVGQSRHTDRLGVTGEDLEWGAYRIHRGGRWLALLGNDTPFVPQGIYAVNRGHWINEKQAAWIDVAGIDWGNPIGAGLYNKYNKTLDLWRYDQKGTLNAVYGFLRELGVRWYMPGELGEIVPQRQTIELPEGSRTVRPDYDIRMVAYARYGIGERAHDEILWSLRLGVNDPYGYHTHHGIANVTRSQTLRDKHPDYFALYNGERQVVGKTANACLSSEGLFEENLRFVRLMFDMYDVPVVSVWPDDGFSSMCQCEKCKGKDTPERGRQGLMSDYVWDYVNRMAIEVEKTHPGKLISCGAYSTYWLPPARIEKLHPNVVVYIVNGRRRYPQEDAAERRDVARQWARMSDNKVITFMNVGGGANTPRIFAEDIRDLKGLAMGEDMWPPFSGGMLANPGFNHLNYYLSARYEWDADQDIDQVLEEYYRLYYGPAAEAMAAFVAFYEQHQGDMRAIDSAPMIKTALDLFEAAKQKADPESVYGQRLALFEEGLAGRRKRYEEIKDGRVDVPTYSLARNAEEMTEIVVDGKLEEAFWDELPGTLKDLQTGGDVTRGTRFKIGVHENHLYWGARCRIPSGEVSAVELARDDFGIWNGDVVEILLETPENSYYQIAVNPMGSVTDLDRSAGLAKGAAWDAQAEVAVQIDEEAGYWTVEARIPFTNSSQDPLHEIIGPAPSEEQPWHFNVCRQWARNRRTELEMSAFSPTGGKGFHNLLKFATLK